MFGMQLHLFILHAQVVIRPAQLELGCTVVSVPRQVRKASYTDLTCTGDAQLCLITTMPNQLQGHHGAVTSWRSCMFMRADSGKAPTSCPLQSP